MHCTTNAQKIVLFNGIINMHDRFKRIFDDWLMIMATIAFIFLMIIGSIQ